MNSKNQPEDRRHLRGIPEKITSEAAPYVQDLITQTQEWLPARHTLILNLKGIAGAIDECNTAANVANVTGSSAAVVGTSVVVGSLIVPVAAPLLAFCTALGVIGSVYSAGTKIAETVFQGVKIKEAERLIAEEKVLVEKIKTAIENIQRVARLAAPGLQNMSLQDITYGILINGIVAMKNTKIMVDMADDIINISAGLMDDVLAGAGASLNAGQAVAGMAKVLGKTVLVVSIPLTLYSMLMSVRQLKGNAAAASENLRNVIRKMEEEHQQMLHMYNQLQRESARYR